MDSRELLEGSSVEARVLRRCWYGAGILLALDCLVSIALAVVLRHDGVGFQGRFLHYGSRVTQGQLWFFVFPLSVWTFARRRQPAATGDRF